MQLPMKCSRCGAPSPDSRWCRVCGLDFASELSRPPTAESFAAKARERRWLAENPEEADRALGEERERERMEAAARTKQSWVEQAQRSKEARQQWRQQWLMIGGMVLGLVFPLGGLIVAVILLVKGRIGAGLAVFVASGLGFLLGLVLLLSDKT
jgi:ABC-type nickel/cobalt efflux system permease component RcnA